MLCTSLTQAVLLIRLSAVLSRSLTQADRTRAIYELAIQQPVLDMPEALWKVRHYGRCHMWGKQGTR